MKDLFSVVRNSLKSIVSVGDIQMNAGNVHVCGNVNGDVHVNAGNVDCRDVSRDVHATCGNVSMKRKD